MSLTLFSFEILALPTCNEIARVTILTEYATEWTKPIMEPSLRQISRAHTIIVYTDMGTEKYFMITSIKRLLVMSPYVGFLGQYV